MTVDAFISYSSKDKATANAACAALEASGIRCWIAPRDIRAGAEYGAGIIEGIDACRVMVLIFSSNANASQQIHREIERAVSKGLTIIPFRIQDILPTAAMEYYLGAIHWLDALTPPLAQHLTKLVEQVGANLQVEAGRPRGASADIFGGTSRPQLSRSWLIPHAAQFVLAILVVALSAAVFLIWRSMPGPPLVPDHPVTTATGGSAQTPAPPLEQPSTKPSPLPLPQTPARPQPPVAPQLFIMRSAGFGGNGGVAFDELDFNVARSPVSMLSVGINLNPADQSQRVVGSLQVYWGGNFGPLHGGKGPLAQPATQVSFASGEKIGRVDINWGPYHYPTSDNAPPQWVAGLQIWTDIRVYAFGDMKLGYTSQCVLANKEVLLGFFGRAGSYIDQLGCIIGKYE